MNVVKIICIILALFAVSAVAWYFYPKANMDYAAAERTNTIAAYQHFLDVYPKDERRQTVLARIDQMSWELAQKANTTADVDAYLSHFPNGRFVKDANSLKDNLEIASLPDFEGSVSAIMGMGGGLDSNGELSLGGPLLELDTKSGNYQILTDRRTIYQGMKESNRNVEWELGKQFRIRGTLTSAPKGPHLGDVKFIDARVIQEIGK